MKFGFSVRLMETPVFAVTEGLTAQTDWLDAPGLAAWITDNTSYRAHGDELIRQVESWRWSKRVNAYDADDILTQLHVNLNELPANLWVRHPRGELKQAALDLLSRGEKGKAVAAMLGLSPSVVSEWNVAARRGRNEREIPGVVAGSTLECRCDPRTAVTHDLEGDEVCTACGKQRPSLALAA